MRSTTVSRRQRQQLTRFARQLDADLRAAEPLALTSIVSWWLALGVCLQTMGAIPGRPLAPRAIRPSPLVQRGRGPDMDVVPAIAIYQEYREGRLQR